jgi:hypothetical protein
MAISFLWLAPRIEAGGLGRRRSAGLPATTANGKRGKRRRATRGFFSLTHLGSGRREETASRAAADWWWWWWC